MKIKFILFIIFNISSIFNFLSAEETEKKEKYSEILNKQFVNLIKKIKIKKK